MEEKGSTPPLPPKSIISMGFIWFWVLFTLLNFCINEWPDQSLHPLSLSPLSPPPSLHPSCFPSCDCDRHWSVAAYFVSRRNAGTRAFHENLLRVSECQEIKTSLLKLCHSAPSCLRLRSLLLAWFPVWFIHYLLRSACVRALSRICSRALVSTSLEHKTISNLFIWQGILVAQYWVTAPITLHKIVICSWLNAAVQELSPPPSLLPVTLLLRPLTRKP